MRIWTMLLVVSAAPFVQAQQKDRPGAVAELTPIVVRDSFELRLRPAADRAVLAVAHALSEKQASEEARPPSALFDARFWKYIPITLAPSDPEQFLTPSYSTPAYHAAEAQVRLLEKHALLDH